MLELPPVTPPVVALPPVFELPPLSEAPPVDWAPPLPGWLPPFEEMPPVPASSVVEPEQLMRFGIVRTAPTTEIDRARRLMARPPAMSSGSEPLELLKFHSGNLLTVRLLLRPPAGLA
jgi:hypothetical protein